MRSLKEMLLASSWARELSENQLRSVIDGITVRTIPTGGYVCMKGEPVEYWMGVLDGLVKMASIWSTGKATSFLGLSTGGWFGEGSMLKDEPRKYDVIALRETCLLYTSRCV